MSREVSDLPAFHIEQIAMPLKLEQKIRTALPISVEGVLPSTVRGLTEPAIAQLAVYHGNQKSTLGDMFKISGSSADDDTLHFLGQLKSVNGIGKNNASGNVIIEGDAGRHVGSYMSGGSIIMHGAVDDFLGMGMTGGEIKIFGSAGDHVGANFPGARVGMNRGTIFVEGDVGRGAGQWMRRGTIVVGGDAGAGAGWNMQAGTLIVLNNSTSDFGANMKRGTIVVGNRMKTEPNPMFTAGETSRPPILVMLKMWLAQQKYKLPLEKLDRTFQLFHGDQLMGGRGEVFIPATD